MYACNNKSQSPNLSKKRAQNNYYLLIHERSGHIEVVLEIKVLCVFIHLLRVTMLVSS